MIGNEQFSLGYPVWQWVSQKARERLVDVYIESRYGKSEMQLSYEGTNPDIINEPSMLTFMSHMPGTETYMRSHHCDVRRGIKGTGRDSSFTKMQRYMTGRVEGIKHHRKRSKLVACLRKSQDWMNIVMYLCGFSDDVAALRDLAVRLVAIYPDAGLIDELIETDPEMKSKIVKQIAACRINIVDFLSAFIAMYSSKMIERDDLWVELIFSSPFDAYLLSRMFRRYRPDTLQSSPSNYMGTDAEFAIVATGLGHTILYTQFMRALGFRDIRVSPRNDLPLVEFNDPFP